MWKNLIKYSCLMVCVMALGGCDDDDDDREARPITVTSREVGKPENEHLKKWTGDYTGDRTPDLGALIELDEQNEGEVLFSGEGFNIISMDIDNNITERIEATVWYRYAEPGKKYSLTVSYKDIPGEASIHENISGEIPAGQTLDPEYLGSNGFLPDIDRHVFSHISSDGLIVDESVTATAWYLKRHLITVICTEEYSETEVRERASFFLTHGEVLSPQLIEDMGLAPVIDGYSEYIYIQVDVLIPDEDMEVMVRYFPPYN